MQWYKGRDLCFIAATLFGAATWLALFLVLRAIREVAWLTGAGAAVSGIQVSAWVFAPIVGVLVALGVVVLWHSARTMDEPQRYRPRP